MTWSLWIILAVVLITLVSGVLLNVTMVVVHAKNRRQRLRTGGYDKIVLTITSANALFQILVTYGGILLYSGVFLLLPDIALSSFFFMFLSFSDLCFWNTSWLSICYCLKLVNFSHQVLLWIKSRFSSALSMLLLETILGSFLTNLPFLWATIKMPLDNAGNSSVHSYDFGLSFSFIAVKVILGSFMPFLLTLLCILLSVKSLLRHIWRIQKNSSDMKSSQLEGHIRAVRTMSLLLVLDLISCAIVMATMLFSLNVGVVLGNLAWIMTLLFPSLQSVILITGNPKLMKRQKYHDNIEMNK
ncbi:hypothetical protein GDO81_027797 [Engystomops pustulosus]|uniref:Taste receptor type 2 n=1 Tax=Engystomops pustulosus TaxID=76066 RepID=A0AAV6ZSA6_ENGPU|nr:hypothetical protein GDO81_027797 [Engystomops pustulosus]